MIFSAISKAIFGDKGLTGGVMDVLKSTGIIKDPELALKAEQALRDYELSKGNQEIQFEQIAAADRDSARKREMEVKDKTPRQIAWVSFVGFFAILIILMFVDVPATAKDALLIMLGTLAGIVTSIAAYYFGSSSGSARKSELIDKLVEKK